MYFNSLGCVVSASNGEMLAIASSESNLYQLDRNVMNGAETNYLACSDGTSYYLELWHKRSGHLNVNNVKMLQNMVQVYSYIFCE